MSAHVKWEVHSRNMFPTFGEHPLHCTTKKSNHSLRTFDPLRSETGKANLSSSSISSLSRLPRMTMLRFKPRVLLASVSCLTKGTVFGVHPAKRNCKIYNVNSVYWGKHFCFHQSIQLELVENMILECTFHLTRAVIITRPDWQESHSISNWHRFHSPIVNWVMC